MRNRLGLASLALAATLAGGAFAGPLEDAGAAYKRGDYATAMKLVRPVAEQGNTSAQYNLGTMYYNGEGTRRDYAEALKWYRMAADRGDAESQNNLGVIYSDGKGVPANLVEATKWFKVAAARFPASEKEKRDKAMKNSELLAKKMTPTQVAEADKLAREWKPK